MTAPVIDCEPPPQRVTGCPPPTPAALRRRHPRPLRPHRVVEPAPSREAAVFADAALRRVLEVIDRRRPIGQLRAMLAPPLVDSVTALARRPHTTAANLRRVRLRCVEDGAQSAEVFATYTRGRRVHAIAAKVARVDGTHRWRVEALQIG